jgi:UDP-3-O-[3-hydroxymyristoyl] glucosamine N-acyltransferase
MRLHDIAHILGGLFLGDDEHELSGLKPLCCAAMHDLSVFAWPKDLRRVKSTKATALIMTKAYAAEYADMLSSNIIAVDNLAFAFKQLAMLKAQGLFATHEAIAQSSIHQTALISPYAIIGRARIGAYTKIAPHVVIGDDVVVGSYCRLSVGSVLMNRSSLGDRCTIGAHSVIGSDAFAPCDNEAMLEALPSLGRVIINNDVRIGALCTIDRGLVGDTHIKSSCHIDNQVHVGHDVVLESQVAIAAQTGLAGFVHVGHGASLGGQVGVAPQLFIGEGARVSAKSFVHKNILPYEICSGNPGLPHELYLKEYKKSLSIRK